MKNSSKRLIIASVLSGLAFAGAAFAQTTFTEVKPRLEIQIPGVEFTSALNDTGNLTLPWIGQYISGIYTFLISIVGLVAAVMMIIGGFQYLTAGGDKSRVDAGRKRITNALIGLILALGSYAILYTINPHLVQFEGLQLSLVQSDPFDEVWDTTETDTDAETRAAEASTSDEGGPAPGAHVSEFPNCPLTLPGTANNATNRQAFADQVQSSGKLTAPTAGGKVVQVADMAVACGMRFGHCGRTAGFISAVATNAVCLQKNILTGCNDFHGYQVKTISSTQRRYLWGWRCTNMSGYEKYDRGTDCKDTANEAMAEVRKKLVSEIPGWPEKWAEALEAGDYVKVYSGITDPLGSHSLIFTGWGKGGVKGGKMQAVSGSSGTATHANKAICVTPKCGQNYQLLLYIYRPR